MRQATTAMAALLLAACGGGGGAADSDNAADAAKAGGAGQPAGAEAGETAGAGGGTVTARLEPGLWESTTEVLSVDMPNMPRGITPPLPPATTVRSCLTPEQSSRPPADLMSGSGDTGGCTYRDFSMADGRLQGTLQCEAGGGAMTMTMNGSYTPTAYDLAQQVETSAQGMTMRMESRTTGRRVGDC